MANEPKPGSSSGQDTQECDDDGLHHSSINGENTAADSLNVSINDTCGTSGSLEPNTYVSVEETTPTNYGTVDNENGSASDFKCDANPSSTHDALEVENKAEPDSSAEDNTQSCSEGMYDTCAVGLIESKVPVSENATADSKPGDETVESASDSKNLATTPVDYSVVDMGNKTLSGCLNQENAESCENGDSDDVHAGDDVTTASDIKAELTVKTICTHSQSGDKLEESPIGNSVLVPDKNRDNTPETGKKTVLGSPAENNIHCTRRSDTRNVDPVAKAVVSDEVEVGISVDKTTLADSQSSASAEKCGATTNADALGMENKLAVDLRNGEFCEDQSRICNGGSSPH